MPRMKLVEMSAHKPSDLSSFRTIQRGYLERASTQKAKGDKRRSEQPVVVAHFFCAQPDPAAARPAI